MRNALIGLLSLSAIALPGAALAEGGAAAGAATGAITGAVVGGPIGAAVGAGVGGIAGAAADDANRRPDAVVIERRGVDCATRTTRTENAFGESKTVTTQSCD
ncbi:glycine zipper domain-containing protein [Enterovirga aerilata]|uniref:Glycine zipper domain-containing protein n=1 Tax=Enterovirga aerilata TaxID=2730920 RepID=A0A849IB25_9HYPH|nr:glycine zipper domain-containing protein [Enterovirga sp. DB1703]NNM73187.1 hypothetical protein [Enterovirga sp. DB1703]